MPVDAELRSLEVEVPSQPEALVELSLLLADDDADVQSMGALIESDMALASAVLKAVNSSLYGLSGRVQTVHQAVTYLGTREVAALTFELGLRAVFPAAAELDAVWERARVRGLLMGRIGQALSVDPWAAHSAGLFEECGKAVLFRHAAPRYRSLLDQANDNDMALIELERREFGVSHDALGAAMCESWGLAPAAVHSVRYHVTAIATGQLPEHVQKRSVCALSVLAHALMTDPDTLDDVAATVAPQADLDPALVLRGARRVQQQIEAAVARDSIER